MLDYKTVSKIAYDEFTEKKSRFIGYCRPVSTEEEAIDFINSVKALNRTATHNVYAYILRENNIMRYTDDGEPAGTAGMPVLDVLRLSELTDVCVVVTRYFGGTLLGTGGLVRAYTRGARIAVEAAGEITLRYCDIYSLTLDYSLLGKLQYAVAESKKYDISDISYTDSVTMTVSVRRDDSPAFLKLVADTVQGAVTPVLLRSDFVAKK